MDEILHSLKHESAVGFRTILGVVGREEPGWGLGIPNEGVMSHSDVILSGPIIDSLKWLCGDGNPCWIFSKKSLASLLVEDSFRFSFVFRGDGIEVIDGDLSDFGVSHHRVGHTGSDFEMVLICRVEGFVIGNVFGRHCFFTIGDLNIIEEDRSCFASIGEGVIKSK